MFSITRSTEHSKAKDKDIAIQDKADYNTQYSILDIYYMAKYCTPPRQPNTQAQHDTGRM